jgi:hypothetical protein
MLRQFQVWRALAVKHASHRDKGVGAVDVQAANAASGSPLGDRMPQAGGPMPKVPQVPLAFSAQRDYNGRL